MDLRARVWVFQKFFVGGKQPGRYVELHRLECYFQDCKSVLCAKFFGTEQIQFFVQNITNSSYSGMYLATLKMDLRSRLWVFPKFFVGGKQPGRYVELHRLECYFQDCKSVLCAKFFGTAQIQFFVQNITNSSYSGMYLVVV